MQADLPGGVVLVLVEARELDRVRRLLPLRNPPSRRLTGDTLTRDRRVSVHAREIPCRSGSLGGRR